MRIVYIIIFLFALTGCEGIGGASWDSEDVVKEVNNYKDYISPLLSEEVLQGKCKEVSQHFNDIFRFFSFSVERVERKSIELDNSGFTASFLNHKLIIRKDNQILIEENLPSVFIMHPIRLGIDKLDGKKIIMIINKSRSTTGRYFVAIYSFDGVVLYRKVLTAAQVWDIKKADSYIDIMGCKEIRRISYNKTYH